MEKPALPVTISAGLVLCGARLLASCVPGGVPSGVPGRGHSPQAGVGEGRRGGKEGRGGLSRKGQGLPSGNRGGDRRAFAVFQPGVPRRMSPQAWAWGEEDRPSPGPISSTGSFYQSGSECEMEEHLRARAQALESDSDRRCGSESLSSPAGSFGSDVPQVVPCKFVISLAFPVTAGKRSADGARH